MVNIALFAAKFYAFWISGSKAVLASLVDSFVDLVRGGRESMPRPSHPAGGGKGLNGLLLIADGLVH